MVILKQLTSFKIKARIAGPVTVHVAQIVFFLSNYCRFSTWCDKKDLNDKK